MRPHAPAIFAVLLYFISMGAAFAQMPAYSSPPDEVDSETVLGFIVIVAAGIGYWLWKRSRGSQRPPGAAKQQESSGPVVPPVPPRESRDPAREPQTIYSQEARESTGSVFISYRRGDAGDVVGRIYDRLVDRFGRAHVFKDVDSIPLGVDFRKQLSESVGKCRVFLAIISRGWLQQTDGERRIDQSNDFVRIEMEAALQRNIPVIPVLVQGASLPNEQELPASLRELAYRNATVVRADPDFHADIARLMDGIAFHLKSEPDPANRARSH
jgi:hypothetical protein